MNKKFIFGILVLGVLVSASFVSAGLFSKMTITGNAISVGWTDWYDRDNPSGNGDYELLNDLVTQVGICENPVGIECRRVSDKIDYSETGQNVVCDLEYGFYCLNKLNVKENLFSASCNDYEVRFYCADGSCGNGICDNGETASTCSIDCGEENVCADTCSSMGYECGSVCGMSCGTCANGEVCSSGTCVGTGNSATCTDSDGGLNYYVAGKISYSEKDEEILYKKDKCVTPNSDPENQKFYVEDNGISYMYNNFDDDSCDGSNCYIAEAVCGSKIFEVHKCPNGCSNGACIKSSEEVTYQGVLNMLSSCRIYAYENIDLNSDGSTTGNEVCEYHGMTCVLAESFYNGGTNENADYHSALSRCSTKDDYSVLRTVCCSAP